MDATKDDSLLTVDSSADVGGPRRAGDKSLCHESSRTRRSTGGFSVL